MSDAPTPPWGIRVEPDVGNEYAEGIEHLRTRLLHIGLFLLTVVILGGAAGVLMVLNEGSRAAGVSIAVVAGCVLAVLVSLLVAMSAIRKLTELARRPRPAAFRPVPRPAPEPVAHQRETPQEAPRPEARQVEASPLWARPGEQQVTITDDPGQRREVFVKLARRLQSLINRAIKRIDELEQDNEDPELLDGLYEIDHLFTLARRQGENLAVLGGEAPQRRSNKPVSVYAVLLAAVSEAEHYRQIAIVPVEDVEIHGHAVAEIIHLLAELLENATRFSAPDGPKVEVRAHMVTAGLAIEVQDRGLGMSHEDLERINHLLDGSTRIDLSELLEDGRIGLAVVRELARRHSIRVRLQSNIFGGIAAAVVIPPLLLSRPEQEARHQAAPQQHRPSALPRRRTERNATSEAITPVPAPASLPSSLPLPSPSSLPSPAPRTSTATESAPALTPAGARTAGPVRVSSPAPIPAVSLNRSENGVSALSSTEPGPDHAPRSSASLSSPVSGEPSGPVQVPAPMPIPTASTPASPGLGPIRPSLPNRHRVAEGNGADDLPVLPTRAPGLSYEDLRTGGDGLVSEETIASQGDQPPPLPQRRGSHLREELLEPPAPTRPVPGHNTSLMKTVQAGRENWLTQHNNVDENRGDSWPTT